MSILGYQPNLPKSLKTEDRLTNLERAVLNLDAELKEIRKVVKLVGENGRICQVNQEKDIRFNQLNFPDDDRWECYRRGSGKFVGIIIEETDMRSIYRFYVSQEASENANIFTAEELCAIGEFMKRLNTEVRR